MSEADRDNTIENHRGFWTGETGPFVARATDRPLGRLKLPLADGTSVEVDTHLKPDMLSASLLTDIEESPARPRLQPDKPGGISGDVFIVRPPLTRMCWVEAVLGCPVAVRVDAGSIYSEPYLGSPGDLDLIPGPRENGWLDFLEEYARVLVENAKGRYYVSLPLMRGTIDLVAALLGYDEMCFSFFDEPDQLRKLSERCLEAYLQVAETINAVIPQVGGGRVSRFNMWAPGSVAITQCDASAALSVKTYEEFFYPYDVETMKSFEKSIVHLHSGYLHTIDTFLKTEHPSAIQISLDTGSTPLGPYDLIPVFKKVLDKKPLFITGPCTREELDYMLDSLSPKGLCIVARLMEDSTLTK